MNNQIHTVVQPVIEISRNVVDSTGRPIIGKLVKDRIKKELPLEKAALKSKHLDMMLSLGIDDTRHKHADEIAKMVDSEWHVGMQEINSGNGSYHTDWNPEELNMVQGTDSMLHDESGLSNQFTDGYNGNIVNKNEKVVFNEATREMELVSDSQYSIWDTIYMKGQLIVRSTAPWKSGFNLTSYLRTKSMHLKSRHNRLMGIASGTQKSDTKLVSGYEQRKAKRLQRLSNRSLNKIGYNAYVSA